MALFNPVVNVKSSVKKAVTNTVEDQRQKDYAAKQEAAYAKRQQAAYAQKQQDRYAAKQQAAWAAKRAEKQSVVAKNPTLNMISQNENAQASPTVSAVSQNETAPNEAIKRRYEALQSNLKAREGAQAQMEQDAINRRFASMGAGNSGAALKTSMLVADAAARREGEARNALSAAQSGEEQAALENAAGRNLQREGMRMSAIESALGRNMQREGFRMSAVESALGRNLQREGMRFQAGQDDKMRAFQSREAQLGRKFEGQQAGLTREFQGQQAELQRALQTKELDQLARQWEQEFDLNKKVSYANMKIAKEQARLDRQGFIGSIFGDLGAKATLALV